MPARLDLSEGGGAYAVVGERFRPLLILTVAAHGGVGALLACLVLERIWYVPI